MSHAGVNHRNQMLTTALIQHGLTAQVRSFAAPLEIDGTTTDGRTFYFHCRNGIAWLAIAHTLDEAVQATIGVGPGDAVACKCSPDLASVDTDEVYAVFARLLPPLGILQGM